MSARTGLWKLALLMDRHISVLVYDTMPGNKRLEITFQRRYMDSSVNAIYVMAGSRSGRIQRSVPITFVHETNVWDR